MADELTETYSFMLVNGNLRAQFPQIARKYSQPTAGMSDQVLSIGTTAEAVTFGDVATPGVIVLHNLDAANYIEFGPDDGGTMKNCGKVNAGEVERFRLASGVTLKLKANTAACKVRVLCLET